MADLAGEADEVAEDPDGEHQDRRDGQDRPEDNGLEVAVSPPLDEPRAEEWAERDERADGERQSDSAEEPERPVGREHTQDGERVPPDVAPGRSHEPRVSRLRIRPHRYPDSSERAEPGLDRRFDRIRVPVDDNQIERGLPAVGAEAGSRVERSSSARKLDDTRAQPLELALHPGELGVLVRAPVPDDDVRVSGEDRSDQVRDRGRVVLVIRVGVDDDVGTGS